jgi:uncharacterized protein
MRSIILKFTIACLLLLAFALPSLAENETDMRTIKVSGEAEIKVVPDRVIIMLGVEKTDKVMAEAKKQNDKIVKAATDAAANNGVREKDISTEFFNVAPVYDDHNVLVGYQVRRRMVVTLNDITKFESLITDLLSSGVENIQNVQFQTTELRKYRDQARANALKAASEKAQAMASELGLQVGQAQSIDESGSRWSSYYGGWYNDYYGGHYMSQNSVQEIPAPVSDENPIALGMISVTASVGVSFELK